MIGVIAKPSEEQVVREFFELFKTSWEFYRPDRRYDVLLVAAGQIPENKSGLVVVYGGEQVPADAQLGLKIRRAVKGGMLVCEQQRLPIYRTCVTFEHPGPGFLFDEETTEPVAIIVSSAAGVVLRVGLDLFQEIACLLSQGQTAAQAEIPTLDLHVALLRSQILCSGIALAEIPPVPKGHRLAVCLTHDVDHPAIRFHKLDHTLLGFIYRALFGSVINLCRGRGSWKGLGRNWAAVFRLPFVYLGWARDFWAGFDEYLKMERGLGSTFYVIPRKDHPGVRAVQQLSPLRASRYEAADISEAIQKLLAAGCEVGLHGLDAWTDSGQGRDEADRIGGVTGRKPGGIRMHWLYFDQESPAILEKAQFDYDSTVGYNEAVGFRAGTMQVYKPLSVARLLELPLHVMDTALFYPSYLNLTPAQARVIVTRILDWAERLGGVLTFNWHDRSVAPERLWDDFYRWLLAELKGRQAWFPTAGQAVSWFAKRRAAHIETEAGPEGQLRIKASAESGADADTLPGLTIRVYAPAKKAGESRMPGFQSWSFTEVPLNASVELKVAN